MGLGPKGTLSPYWQRITAKAEDILEKKIDSLERQSVDPELCLAKSDKQRMERLEMDIKANKSVLKTIKQGRLAGKLWAFDTVWGHNPCLVFK